MTGPLYHVGRFSPRWVGRALPKISVEGSEYLASREAKPRPASH
jgi:hypothetical protein